MPTTRAAHFSPELFRFLRALKRNNNRAWFEANKDRYREVVRDPLLAFIADFGAPLRKISPYFVADPRPQGGSMFRIYRDLRFSRDRRPYKTAASAQFRHVRGKDVHAPGYYLHLEPGSVFVGMGIWCPDGPALQRIRQSIAAGPDRWRRIQRAGPFRATFRMHTEDTLVRPPRGFDPDHPLIDDLKLKSFVVVAELDEKTACSPRFLPRVARICRTGSSFMRFLTRSVGQAF